MIGCARIVLSNASKPGFRYAFDALCHAALLDPANVQDYNSRSNKQTFNQNRDVLLWYVSQVDGLTALAMYPMLQFELSLSSHDVLHSQMSIQDSAVFECVSILVTISVMQPAKSFSQQSSAVAVMLGWYVLLSPKSLQHSAASARRSWCNPDIPRHIQLPPCKVSLPPHPSRHQLKTVQSIANGIDLRTVYAQRLHQSSNSSGRNEQAHVKNNASRCVAGPIHRVVTAITVSAHLHTRT